MNGRTARALWMLALGAPLFAQAAGAQRGGAPPLVARRVIAGTVADTSLRPIAAADVMVIGTNSRLTADADGRFQILDVPPGEFLIWVRRLGYRPVSSVVHVEPGDTLRLAFTLEPAVTELGAVVVTEKARSVKMREFDERRRAGLGEFLDQAQIESLNFVTLEGVVRTFKAVRVATGTGSGGAYVARATSARWTNCPMQVYLDGMPRGADLTTLPSPREIAGVEVYSGPATAPIGLLSGTGGQRSCGVILLWTRDGS